MDGFRGEANRLLNTAEIFDTLAFIAQEGDQFIGAVVVQHIWGALYIKYVYVDAAFRGQGFGKELMHHALQHGQERGCAFAFLETMSYLGAVEFYKKLGFVVEFSRPGYKNGCIFQYLRKDLSC